MKNKGDIYTCSCEAYKREIKIYREAAEEIETNKAIAVGPWCYRIGKRDGAKDLWGIKQGYKQQLGILESRIVELKSRLSEERARTLNSEAVQGMADAAQKIVARYKFVWMAPLIKALEKFQQFKDGNKGVLR